MQQAMHTYYVYIYVLRNTLLHFTHRNRFTGYVYTVYNIHTYVYVICYVYITCTLRVGGMLV